jgi:outer membrane biosynthesis protein TonB
MFEIANKFITLFKIKTKIMKNKWCLLFLMFVSVNLSAQTRAERKAAKEQEYQLKRQKEWDAYMIKVTAAEAQKAEKKAQKENTDAINLNNPICENIVLPYFKNGKTRNFAETEALIYKHIIKHFQYPEFAIEHDLEGKVNVTYVIHKNGEVEIVSSEGPKNGLILEEEAPRVISLLPKFVPSTCNGEAVKVRYVAPIIFKLHI